MAGALEASIWGHPPEAALDRDGDGVVDGYHLTLKFPRPAFIAGFKDAQGAVRISQPSTVTVTLFGDSLAIGQDPARVLPP